MKFIKEFKDCLEIVKYPGKHGDPVAIIYQLPKHVFVRGTEEIKVGVWDEDKR